jgi:ubiquinone/menaquinone biosynthesis C-methylase UbiE
MTMDTLKQYVLEADEKSAERLLRQHELYEHASQQLLLQAGLKANLSVLELGCGPGAMTPWLCQQLTKGGQLLAVDLSPSIFAKPRAKQKPMKIVNALLQMCIILMNSIENSISFIAE